MELWDAYTKDGKRTGEILVRGQGVPEGRYHLVSEVLVRHKDGSYLCMKRSREKPNYPGWYEATAGGSALLGEDPLECARRELREETGLEDGAMEAIGVSVSDGSRTIYHTWLCIVDCEKTAVVLQAGETEDYIWMTEPEFIRFVCSGKMIPEQKARYGSYLKRMKYIQ